ncbi:MAG: hypothetical protein M1825_002488 [Sarcosagium campestre]|nr:MAG: hypothetical protein M1825_002488 [Sarcosagium campestre]
MSKRKQKGEDKDPISGRGSLNDESSDEELDTLNVEFEWFDPQPTHDFQGLKTLLRQLLDVDSQLFDLSALANLILSQPLLGSTVKVDGNETDPFAFLTVLNLQEHRGQPVIRDLTSYILDRCTRSTPSSLSIIADQLKDDRPDGTSRPQVGLILTERLINIPTDVVPPMYGMLQEEISWALEEKEPYNFTHYLILSKSYTEVASEIKGPNDDDDRPQKKKSKKGGGGSAAGNSKNEIFYFHPEDEVLERYALAHGRFDYKIEAAEGASDSKRAFQELGIRPQGHMILIEASEFEKAVQAIKDFVSPGQ